MARQTAGSFFARLPRLHIPVIFLTLVLAGLSALAQTFDASNLRQPTTFDTTWLVHGGDDPAYAEPGGDDSQWLRLSPSKQSLHDLYARNPQGVIWYRLHVKVDPAETGLALQEWYISSAFDIYANGIRLMQVGQVAPFVAADYSGRLLAPIPEEQIRTGSLVIALRIHIAPNEWGNPFPGFFPTNLLLGQEGELREHIWLAAIGENALRWLAALMGLGLCLAALLLYSSQRGQREYLWLFLLCLSSILAAPLHLYGMFHTFSASWYVVYAVADLAGPYLLTRMYFAFVRQRIDWRFQLYLAVGCACFAYGNQANSLGLLPQTQWLLWIAPILVLETLILPGVLFVHWRRGNPEAGILLIPALLSSLYFDLRLVSFGLVQISAFRGFAYEFYQLTIRFNAGPFRIELQTVLDIFSALALALILLLRSNRMSRQQALFEGELAAAREVQKVIVPEDVESVPGFTVESVYEPAQQVGGDFFQILPDSRGGLLIVVGDVAGKGLPAAMLVSVIVGAVRTAASYSQSPSEVLSQLNDRLLGRTHGGFSTALAAHITSDGWVTMSNAGHLSPYLDGREIELPGALPLGILGNAAYETTQFHLPHASRLTFYSDGVVEAQNHKGELFGFDRAKAMSTQPAAAIVDAAIRFGQSDDITVVAIRRAAAIATAA
jgi:phosphoserine phosphatase RsbU/P